MPDIELARPRSAHTLPPSDPPTHEDPPHPPPPTTPPPAPSSAASNPKSALAALRSRKRTPPFLLRAATRFLQFVLALAILGVFGVRISYDAHMGQPQDSRWVFALITSVTSCATVLVYMLPKLEKLHILFGWDAVLFVFWLALYLVLSKIFASGKCVPGQVLSTAEYRHAIWVVLVEVGLWVFTACAGLGNWYYGKVAIQRGWVGQGEVAFV